VAESEEQLRSILEVLPGPVLVVDRDGKLLYLNRAVPGFAVEQVIGLSVYDFVPAANQSAMRRGLAEAFATGRPTTYQVIGAGPHGAESIYESQALPMQWGNGGAAVTIVTTDVTQRTLDEQARRGLEEQLRQSVDRLKAYAEELEAKNRLLEAENTERERAERALLRQQEALRALSTPIIQAWEGVLVLPIIGTVDSARATHLMEKLLGEIVRTRARFAVLDLTGVEEADASTMSHLLQVVRATRLLGSRCLLSGIAPTIARTMVDVGAELEGFVTFAQLQDALRHALLESGVRSVGAR
jgi:PAS domain S-box-containing protein